MASEAQIIREKSKKSLEKNKKYDFVGRWLVKNFGDKNN